MVKKTKQVRIDQEIIDELKKEAKRLRVSVTWLTNYKLRKELGNEEQHS